LSGEPSSAAGQLIKNADREVRQGFVRKVYGILSAQLLLTVFIALPFQFMTKAVLQANSWILIASTVVLVVTMCSMMCCGQVLKQFPQNYMFLGLLTSCMGVVVGFTSAMYTWQSVMLAAGITVGIFLGMTIYAWTTTTDFTGAGPYLVGAMLTMMMFGMALSILSMCGVHIVWMVMFYNLCGVLLFTFYIVYDTQLMMGGSHQVQLSIDDYCFAALNLYLDIINLFLHILALLGDRK